MENFQLSVLFKIIGIGSASGLVYHQDKLFIISDNSTFLYEYTIPNESLRKIALVENPQENIPKKDKPDFEAIAVKGNDLVLISSGSTSNRNKSSIYNFTPNDAAFEKTYQKDISGLYQNIRNELHITEDELNIEGVIFNKKDVFLFQRGNGSSGKNGIIKINDNPKNPKLAFFPFDLPKIKNIPTSFTDAILVDDTIYFLAAAENTTSTYEDGDVMGCLIGSINLNTMELGNYLQISDKHKFEGLTLYKKTATEIQFLLCEDADSEDLETSIYKLLIKL